MQKIPFSRGFADLWTYTLTFKCLEGQISTPRDFPTVPKVWGLPSSAARGAKPRQVINSLVFVCLGAQAMSVKQQVDRLTIAFDLPFPLA
jgi:hypothetical protein